MHDQRNAPHRTMIGTALMCLSLTAGAHAHVPKGFTDVTVSANNRSLTQTATANGWRFGSLATMSTRGRVVYNRSSRTLSVCFEG